MVAEKGEAACSIDPCWREDKLTLEFESLRILHRSRDERPSSDRDRHEQNWGARAVEGVGWSN